MTEKTGLSHTDQHMTEQTIYDTMKTGLSLPPLETATATHTNTTNTKSTTTTYINTHSISSTTINTPPSNPRPST